jgi:hypothetical protein
MQRSAWIRAPAQGGARECLAEGVALGFSQWRVALPVFAPALPSYALHASPPPRPRLPSPRQADKFHKTGRQLRSRMWWQNFKMKIIIAAIIILIAIIIFCSGLEAPRNRGHPLPACLLWHAHACPPRLSLPALPSLWAGLLFAWLLPPANLPARPLACLPAHPPARPPACLPARPPGRSLGDD